MGEFNFCRTELCSYYDICPYYNPCLYLHPKLTILSQGEWISCGFLLVFVTVAIVDKPVLTRIDWIFMITFTLCLVFGFFLVIPQSVESAIFVLVLAVVSYGPLLSLSWYDSDIRPINDLEGRELQLFAEGYAKRKNLTLWLTAVLPLVPVTYMLALAGNINAAQTIVIFQILSVFTKGLFVALTMDIHMELIENYQKLVAEEQRADDARRTFMKCIFHEVRLGLGLELGEG
jgi:hypothetical protein